VGSLALGYSTGNFFGGLIADHWGYALTFQLGAALSLVAVALLWWLRAPSAGKLTWAEALRAMVEPELAIVVLVAMFLNLLHQMGGVFISLYGLGVGMTLTQIGVLRAAFAGCNAVTRPISGHVVNRLGHKGLSYFGLPLQSLLL